MTRLLALMSPFFLLSGSLAFAAEPIDLLANRLEGWQFKGDAAKSQWRIGQALLIPGRSEELLWQPKGAVLKVFELVNTRAQGVDAYTKQEHGDCKLSLEFMVPKGSNSGVYLMGEYEVQILDSFGKEEVGPGDLGGIYGYSAPKENAAKAPGEWQKMEIDFLAPKFEEGKKVGNARFLKVVINGKTVQENVEVKAPTLSCLTGKEKPKGPLMLQGDHGPVAFRKMLLEPK